MTATSLEIHEIEQAKNDNLFLSKFSTLLSNVRNRRQLFNLINQHVGNYLVFKCFTVFTLNDERNAMFNYFGNDTFISADTPFCNCKTTDTSPKDYQAFTTEPYEINMSSFNFDDFSEKQPISGYLKPSADNLVDDWLIVNLCNRDSVFAQWVLLAASNQVFSIHQKEVLQTAGKLLSLTLLNLRYEEIINDKDAESETLQSLNIDFASIRNKK